MTSWTCIFIFVVAVGPRAFGDSVNRAAVDKVARCTPKLGLAAQDTVAVNMVFETYPRFVSDGTEVIRKGLNKNMANFQKFSAPAASSQLNFTSGKFSSKRDILERISKSVSGKQSVMFNYSGHAVPHPDHPGQTALLLPGVSQSCYCKVAPYSSGCSGNEPAKCKNLDDYLITASELKPIFGNRKIFGFNVSCYSGGFDLGPNSAVIYSSTVDQTTEANVDEKGSYIVSEAEQILTERSCQNDLNGDGRLDYGEVYAAIRPRSFPVEVDPAPAKTASAVDGGFDFDDRPKVRQELNGMGSAAGGWTHCITMARVEGQKSECKRDGEDTGGMKQIAGTDVPLLDSVFPKAQPVCKLGAKDEVLATGRITGNGFAEVKIHSENCPNATGWVAQKHLRPLSGPSHPPIDQSVPSSNSRTDR